MNVNRMKLSAATNRKINAALSNMKTIPLNIQKIERASGDTFRVVAEIPLTKPTAGGIAETITARFNRQLRYLPDSLVRTEIAGLYTFMVKGNVPVRQLSETASAGMTEIAANVFKDSDDCIWSLSEDASGNKIYVRNDIDDYEDIMKAARSANIVTASLEVATAEVFAVGQVVSFYDVANESRRTGIAVNEHEVFVPETDNIVAVSPKVVLATTDERFVVTAADSDNKRTLLDYFRRLYGQNAQFYGDLKKLVDQYLAV